mmetsp:Transcript_131/g.436  ORF Transcript_131/g.436 Transcript_131/m.436 type:complete len:354 (+) Transcript_131:24-1085(+)
MTNRSGKCAQPVSAGPLFRLGASGITASRSRADRHDASVRVQELGEANWHPRRRRVRRVTPVAHVRQDDDRLGVEEIHRLAAGTHAALRVPHERDTEAWGDQAQKFAHRQLVWPADLDRNRLPARGRLCVRRLHVLALPSPERFLEGGRKHRAVPRGVITLDSGSGTDVLQRAAHTSLDARVFEGKQRSEGGAPTRVPASRRHGRGSFGARLRGVQPPREESTLEKRGATILREPLGNLQHTTHRRRVHVFRADRRFVEYARESRQEPVSYEPVHCAFAQHFGPRQDQLDSPFLQVAGPVAFRRKRPDQGLSDWPMELGPNWFPENAHPRQDPNVKGPVGGSGSKPPCLNPPL